MPSPTRYILMAEHRGALFGCGGAPDLDLPQAESRAARADAVGSLAPRGA